MLRAMNVDRSAHPPPARQRPRICRRLRAWLDRAEVRRWWGDPSEQFELLRGDLNEPLMTMRIVSLGGRPFAYAQDYDVHSLAEPHLSPLAEGIASD